MTARVNATLHVLESGVVIAIESYNQYPDPVGKQVAVWLASEQAAGRTWRVDSDRVSPGGFIVLGISRPI
jgi:hypothetical protein